MGIEPSSLPFSMERICSRRGTQGAGCSKIKYLSVAPMFGEAIERIYQEISIAKLFN